MGIGGVIPVRGYMSTAHILSPNALKNGMTVDRQDHSTPKVAAWEWGLNGFLVPSETHTHFAYHRKLDDYYVQVIDNKTNRVVREVPPKEVLDRYVAIAEKFGIIIDERL